MKDDNKRIFEAYLSELRSTQSKHLGKYQRSINRYYNSIGSHIVNLRSATPVGFNAFEPGEETDTARIPNLNVIKSIIDTLVSKIATVKVRPFFTPVQGNYRTIKILRQVQLYFDDFFDKQDVNKKISLAFRDACIFDTGVIFVDPFTYQIRLIHPWQCSVMTSEYNFGKPYRVLLSFDDYPTSHLQQYGIDLKRNQVFCKFEIYIDVDLKEVRFLVDQREIKKEKYDHEDIPICFIHYTNPVKGAETTSITDDLNAIQENINTLASKIYTAAELTPANTIFVPEGSNLSVDSLNNRVGNVMKYKPLPSMAGSPISVATPAFINPEYTSLLDYYIQKAYEIVGVSQLSALGKKPSGIDSGKALESMENIESDRFEMQLNNVVRTYVDVAKCIIDTMPDNKDILPKEITRAKLTWKDIKKEAELVNVQYSAQSLLSKDPSVRMEQLTKLMAMGMIPPGAAARYLEMPDINEAFNLATASQMAVETLIETVLENKDDTKDLVEIPDFIDLGLLESTVITLQNQLFSSEDDAELVEKLTKLLSFTEDKILRIGALPVQDATAIEQAENVNEQVDYEQYPEGSGLGGPNVSNSISDMKIGV